MQKTQTKKRRVDKTTVLLLAGIDPTGNAGLIKDIKTCEILRVNYLALPTAFTVQNDERYVHTTFPDKKYFTACKKIIHPKTISAVKIGMLGNKNIVEHTIKLIKWLKQNNPNITFIWDPLLYSTSKGELLSHTGLKLAIKKLIPLIDLITPNLPEAKIILKSFSAKSTELKNDCLLLNKLLNTNVYLKGGHARDKSIDYVCIDNELLILKGKTSKKSIRGTGCLLSSAIASYRDKGFTLNRACRLAKLHLNKIFMVG